MSKENNMSLKDAVLISAVSGLIKKLVELENRCDKLEAQLRQIKSEQSDKSSSAEQSDKPVELPEDIKSFISFLYFNHRGICCHFHCKSCPFSYNDTCLFSKLFKLVDKYKINREVND